MREIKTLLTAITLLFITSIYSQESNKLFDPEHWTEHNCKASFEEGVIHIENTGGTALLWLDGVDFGNGTIELDIKGNDKVSFLGLAFHGLDNENYDAVYFRPFNFKSKEKSGNAIQYIAAPDNDWNILREKFPGKYENAIDPIPDPNSWFHARIVIDFPEVKVYVDHAGKATLAVKQISKRKSGKLGLWVDSDDGRFKNLSIVKNK
ncbi:family 16 glycoside hydrolase [Ulvibacterium sp.]|uniref:family 16 glycoside hydrolase n=1 Tax=Ulvibacterium sp. TaxID=2665914 RepID=UPI003BACC34E